MFPYDEVTIPVVMAATIKETYHGGADEPYTYTTTLSVNGYPILEHVSHAYHEFPDQYVEEIVRVFKEKLEQAHPPKPTLDADDAQRKFDEFEQRISLLERDEELRRG